MAKHVNVPAAGGVSYFVIGDIITVKLTGDDTNNKYFMVEVTCQPGGGPSFLHTHEPQETFFVLEGVFEIYGQDENGEKYAIRAEVGDTVQVPANVPHGFKNVGQGIGRMTLTYEPAEPMHNFFREIGIHMADRTVIPANERDPASIMGILKKYMSLIEMPG
jgi:quercetin dioxygenase-like cupin family protein